MRFKDIIKRLTGISTPIFGVSWSPDNTNTDIAKKVISFLEDKRVLYNPSEAEVPSHCIDSVIEIRKFLTEQIGIVSEKNLKDSLLALRLSCRKFLDFVGAKDDIVRFGGHNNHWASWSFISAIGELRGVFGIHVAKIASMYGLDVEEDLSSIFPECGEEGKPDQIEFN